MRNILDILQKGFTEPIRDVLWGHVYLSPGLAGLTSSAAFKRLRRIMQLGPTFYTYPGATHTRAAHSIGVYHLSRRMLIALAEKGADAWMTPQGVCSFLAASLLHDLGHFPYTHSLKELPLKAHEELTGELIMKEPLKSLIGQSGADPYFTAAIVDSALPSSEMGELLFYRKLLSGALDPDKLDYLNRDAHFSGVPYGAQDIDFIYHHLFPDFERGITIDARGIPSVESILFSKYLMYRTVYWHRSVRAATAMIKKALLAGLCEETIAREELYGLDDEGLFGLLTGRDHPLFYLAAMVRDGQLYTTAAEIPYNEKGNQGLLDPASRFSYEANIAAEFSKMLEKKVSPGEVIIDLPEPVSFETGLYVRDEECLFSESSSAFKAATVDAFVRSLRVIRVFTHPDLKLDIADSTVIRGILQS